MSKAPRPIRIKGDVAYVPLTRGYTAMIDAADVPLVSAWSWPAREKRRPDGTVKSVYAYREINTGEKRVGVALHRAVFDPGHGMLPDHRNGDTLDCRRANLRPATYAENSRNAAKPSHNTSGAKGVVWHKRDRRWAARIKVNGVRHHLGSFRCITAAALAYAKASRDLHGEFGRVA